VKITRALSCAISRRTLSAVASFIRMGTGSVITYKYYGFVVLASGVARHWSVAKIGAARDHA